MNTQTVTLQLPRNLLSRASDVAQRQDVTIGHLVRHLLSKEVDRQLGRGPAEQGERRLIAMLKALVASEMALAENWAMLSLGLADQGYELRPCGGGLAMHKRPCGTKLCKASDLGFPYRDLVKRFRCGMPGHPHGALNLTFEKLPVLQARLPLEDEEPACEVIEYDA